MIYISLDLYLEHAAYHLEIYICLDLYLEHAAYHLETKFTPTKTVCKKRDVIDMELR